MLNPVFHLNWNATLFFTYSYYISFTFLHIENVFLGVIPSQSAFTCSKLTVETLEEQSVKYVQS